MAQAYRCIGCDGPYFNTPKLCWSCQNPRSDEERDEIIQAGIHRKIPPKSAKEKAQMFEEERQRLKAKGKRRKK